MTTLRLITLTHRFKNIHLEDPLFLWSFPWIALKVLTLGVGVGLPKQVKWMTALPNLVDLFSC